jgi:ABC-type sugar transport system substrate-binding protein
VERPPPAAGRARPRRGLPQVGAAGRDAAGGVARSQGRVALGEPIEGFEAALRAAASERKIELTIENSHGLADAQADQIARLLDAKVAVLLFGPVIPDVLQRTRTEAQQRELPMIACCAATVAPAAGSASRARPSRAPRASAPAAG